MRYPSFAGAAGGVKVSLIPRVWRTVRAFPSSQVSLPFSRSMTNLSPVPEVNARSFCVTPRLLRVSQMSLPMSRGVYFMGDFLMLNYRTGILLYPTATGPEIFPFGNIIRLGQYWCLRRSVGAADDNPKVKVPRLRACP